MKSTLTVIFLIIISNTTNYVFSPFQNNIDDLIKSINLQFKKNCIRLDKVRSTKRVDLQGNNLLIYDDDGNKDIFDLTKTKITSEYNSGRYFVKFTCLYDCAYYYDEKGILNQTKSIGYLFNSFQNATLARDTIRKIKTIVNS